MDQHSLSFIIRWMHVLSMALLLGGGGLVLVLAVDSRKQSDGLVAAVVLKYEWVFWLAMGVQVITGIGNIGSFGANLPDARSEWGAKLFVKLSLVTLFVGFSLVRTLLATRLRFSLDAMPPLRTHRAFESLYGISAVLLGAIVLMAEALAHG